MTQEQREEWRDKLEKQVKENGIRIEDLAKRLGQLENPKEKPITDDGRRFLCINSFPAIDAKIVQKGDRFRVMSEKGNYVRLQNQNSTEYEVDKRAMGNNLRLIEKEQDDS